MHAPRFKTLARTAAVLVFVAALGACGGGAEVVVGDDPPPVSLLGIALTRVGPEAIQIDWSDDPAVSHFTVRRDGFALATLATTTLIDASVIVNESYCYRVSGYDDVGDLVAVTDTACITVVP
jgi:hypothetical protein